MSEEFDYYEVLEITKNATAEEIKRAYRKMAIKYHPDKNQGDESAEARFKQINEAYQVLSDEGKRAIYDRYGKAGLEGQGGMGGAGGFEDVFGDFADIFDSFFGGGGGGRRGQRREMVDIAIELRLDFLEAVFGTTKEVHYTWQKPCGTCDGTGGKRQSCDYCGGRGQVYQRQGFMTFSQTCPKCHGQGSILIESCKTCQGKGKESVEESVEITIPEGIDRGQRLRVGGRGSQSRSGARGDLYVVIDVADDPVFMRREDDIYIEAPVFFTLSALGGTIEVPTIRGSKEIEIPRGTRDKSQILLRGEGIGNVHTGRKGHQVVLIKVIYPDRYTAEQEELLVKLHESFGQDGHPHKGLLDDVVERIKRWFS